VSLPPDPRSPKRGLLAPLAIPDFRRLWTGMTVSLFGDGIFLVALAWQAYDLKNTPGALAIVGMAMTGAQVAFLLIGGMVSDRLERRHVMIAADALRGTAVALLGVLSLSGALRLWHLVVVAAVYGSGTAFFGPAFDAIVPELVPDELLQQANSLDQFVRPATWMLAGPAVGGWIASAWSVGGAFLIDALTFVVSIATLLRIRRRTVVREPAGGITVALSEVREGFRYVRSHVWLWGTFLAATIAYLLFWGPTEVLLPYIVRNQMGGQARDLGFILAVGGIGAIFAAIVMGSRGRPRRHITFIYVVWTLSTLAIAGYGFARYPWQAMMAAFAFNALEAAGTIVWATTKQRLVPNRLLGRVSSFDWFISIGLLPLSFGLAGPVAAAIGARTTLVAAGVVGGLATFAFLFLPGMRDTERKQIVRQDQPALALRSSSRVPG
jgi:DHA3 family tetracycline resistance protein-like MFS transporter